MGVDCGSGGGGCVDGQTLTIHAPQWSAALGELLARGVHDPLVSVRSVRLMVEEGCGELLEVRNESGETVGAFVMQQNNCEHGSELVIACAAATLPGYGAFSRSLLPWVELQAEERGLERVRVGAGRLGMGRVLQKLGYLKMTETFIKEVR